jgi:adenylosuccinate lyase
MTLTPLTAISPVDGRYRSATDPLADFFSEAALIRYRVMVEVEYFCALCRLPLPELKAFPPKTLAELSTLYQQFGLQDAARVKDIERETNHDVKAVEYFVKEKFKALGIAAYAEFIHFGLTSQDINNSALPLMLKDAWHRVVLPTIGTVKDHLLRLSKAWKEVAMLARTHGQPASPTTIGKELYVFVRRLDGQLDLLSQVPFSAKFGGAVGNFNAHHAAYPEVDWAAFADTLVSDVFGLKRTTVTTQIEPYDNLAAFCDGVRRVNTILIDLCRDLWTYISLDYFKQKIKAGEVGSSTMPHKVNPIDFENAEGNLGLANTLFDHFSQKLPISRLQRDLTDSTVTRNVGVPLAHTLISLKSIQKGLDKLVLNGEKIASDLEANWVVVAEAIQTILRRAGVPNPYEALKALTREQGCIGRRQLAAFVDALGIPEPLKAELKLITPHNYIGIIDTQF